MIASEIFYKMETEKEVLKIMGEEQSFEKTEIYPINITGILDEKWSDWFDGFTITRQGNEETALEVSASGRLSLVS